MKETMYFGNRFAPMTTLTSVFWTKPKKVSLRYVVFFSYSLCSLIYNKYNKISNEMVQLILFRTQLDNLDENDGQSNSTMWLTKYEGELYLRRLYSILNGQSMGW